jgi:AcrR family transcriptional regulator
VEWVCGRNESKLGDLQTCLYIKISSENPFEEHMASKKRDHLVNVASDLFYQNGYHATGIDTILAEAGVAKMTMYHHFKSKDELILAALEKQDERWREWFVGEVERRAKSPVGRLLAMFDALEETFQREDFRGCPFIKATSEYPSLNHPIHQIAAEHQRSVHAYVRELAHAAGAENPDALASKLCLLMGGAIATAQVSGRWEAARQAREVGRTLVEEAIGSKV